MLCNYVNWALNNNNKEIPNCEFACVYYIPSAQRFELYSVQITSTSNKKALYRFKPDIQFTK